jgi:hypothetical protein
MAPESLSLHPASPTLFSPGSPTQGKQFYYARDEGVTNSSVHRYVSRTSRRMSTVDTSSLTNVVQLLTRRSSDDFGSGASSTLMNTSHDYLLDWISSQRMSHLPPEGSSYDKVLGWAQLFAERLHSFDQAIEQFAGESNIATQLSYGYCALLLELGRENAAALMVSFGFFYSISMSLENLMERIELFTVSQEIREQLVLALSDLVTLVASVATHFHKAIRGLTTTTISVNIYNTFPSEIRTFVDRCETISEAMWRHQLVKESVDTSKVASIKSIKTWLSPEDCLHTNAANMSSHLSHDREELTCLWIGPYLTRFLKSNNHTLSIIGAPGSGKTVLASVITDYLQHSIGGNTYSTLYIPINSRVPAEGSLRAISKNIMLQLFEKRIGNVGLLQVLSDAYQRCSHATNDGEYDAIMWQTIELALETTLPGSKELVIVVDGVDEATCNETDLVQRLNGAAANGTNTKLITLGTEKIQTPALQSSIQVTEELIFDDIASVVRGLFEHNKPFSSLSQLEQETVVTRIAQASKGSFLWAKLATKQLRQEDSSEKLRKAVDSLSISKPTITEFVTRTLQHPNVGDNAKLMLTWLATAERPLSLKVLSTLALVQPEKNSILSQVIDPLSTLKPVNSLAFLHDGMVYLRHGLIREAILDIFAKGKLMPNMKDRHADLVTRLLFYIKSTVTQEREPSMAGLDSHETGQLLKRHPLLDFAIRHWPFHLRKTETFIKEGDLSAAKMVAKVFPSATTALLLQKTLWDYKPKHVALVYQATTTNICRHLQAPKNALTLQSVIFLASLCRDIGLKAESIPLFYEATITANTLFSPGHTVTIQTASTFLELTETFVTTEKSDVMQKREEVLLILIECYKIQYGKTSEVVISTQNRLVEHYRYIKEEHKAQKIIESIRSVTSNEFGEPDSNLHVHLKTKHTERKQVETTAHLQLDVEEHDELILETEEFNFEQSIRQAEKYSTEKKTELAEQAYIEIWQRVSKEYRSHHSEQWLERKMKTVLRYSKFLRSHNRENDASSVLSSVLEENISVTESNVSLLQEMSTVMKSLGLAFQSLSLLKHCSHYYQATSRTSTSAYRDIQQSIHTTSREIMQSAESSSGVTSEATLEKLVLEASTSIHTIDRATFTAIFSLVRLYISQHRWQEATRFVKKILTNVWPALFSPSTQDVAAPPKHLDGCVELAQRLGDCYHARRRLSKEEDIRMRLYKAVRSVRPVEDDLRDRVTADLLNFLRRTSQTNTLIHVREELLEDYTTRYGSDHPSVVKLLLQLAEDTRPRPNFMEYYQRAIRIMNKDSDTCTRETFEPCFIVATELWNRGQFTDSMHYYTIIFATFLKNPKLSPKLQDQAFVYELFSRYTQCLRTTRTDYTTQYKMTSEYRSQCKAVFGTSAPITIRATLQFAKLCQESQTHEHEAVAAYEELLQIKSDEIDHQEISSILESTYAEQTYHAMTTQSHSVSTSQRQRAFQVLQTRTSSIRKTHGWAHDEALSKLTEIVRYHSQQQNTELVISELKEATVNVLSTETTATRLIAAASTIASNYIATSQIHKGMELKEDIYEQIVMKDTANITSTKFDLSFRGRESLVFLAQLESSLRRNSVTTDEILAELTTQYVYFENFRRVLHSKSSSLQEVCIATARLHRFLVGSGREIAATRVFDDCVDYFTRTEGKKIGLVKPSQVTIFLETLMQHFSTHKSQDFVRSVGISGINRVGKLLRAQDYAAGCDLALACFTYISAQSVYRTPVMAKLVLILGMTVAGRDIAVHPDPASHKMMLEVSATIIPDVLYVLGDLRISLEEVSLEDLNSLIGLLGEQQDYNTLSWLLTILWNSREAQQNWHPSITLALGRRYITAKYLVGDSNAALRLAEDIVYNCRRVHGILSPSTLEMSTFLSQLYTSIAQAYQGQKGGQDMANRYYKKSAAIHENILRALTDPAYAEMEAGLDCGMSQDGNGGLFISSLSQSTRRGSVSDAETVRRHLQLLKLSLERLGGWPKDYGEYQRLNADIFRLFGADLKGEQGIDKWNINSFGSGKSESNDDCLDAAIKNWELEYTRMSPRKNSASLWGQQSFVTSLPLVQN